MFSSMPRLNPFVALVLPLATAFPAFALGQSEPLSLQEALRLAKERNGTIRAAQYDVSAAKNRVDQAYSAFLPSVTPQYQYNSIRNDGRQPLFVQDGDRMLFSTSWRLLDSGERDFSYRSSRRAVDATRFNAVQTLRSTLFIVTQTYLDALRTQELQRVAEGQISRTQQILEQTEARILARDAAEIERLQANADYQNAKVQALVARNRVVTTMATLKSTIGFDKAEPLPELVKDDQTLVDLPANLTSLLSEGVSNRPDLLSRRSGVESELLSRQRAQREAGISFALDLNDDYQFGPNRLNNRTVGFLISYPLFDGGRRRSIVRELGANIDADRALLAQAERNVRAEIESTYNEAANNVERLGAAKVALEAAQKNYQAAVDSRDKGAAALQQVLTAQASLLTAESNYIDALYDARISDVRLRLVTGRPIPGETS